MKKGFTLIELLLYTSVSAILLMGISIFFSALLESRIKNQTIAEVEQQGIQIMQEITSAVRNGSTITSPTPGQTSTSLTIQTTSSTTNPITFSTTSTRIQIQEGSADPILLSNNRVAISALQFTNLSDASAPDSIRIQFTLTYQSNTDRQEYQYAQTFGGTASMRIP